MQFTKTSVKFKNVMGSVSVWSPRNIRVYMMTGIGATKAQEVGIEDWRLRDKTLRNKRS